MRKNKQTKSFMRQMALITMTLLFIGGYASAQAQSQDVTPATSKGPSGKPLPRFVSLKADRVNVRKGPSTEHGVNWIYRRIGLPVEIIQEFEHWRQIRDAEGAEGWVFYRLLSARRTALISPWSESNDSQAPNGPIPIFANASSSATIVARVESGVLANVQKCDGKWCEISFDSFRGWVEQIKLWGVYRGEKF